MKKEYTKPVTELEEFESTDIFTKSTDLISGDDQYGIS